MRSAWGEFIRMIFVTTGSQKFQFNRLLQKIDLLIEEGMIREEVFAQIGVSDYQPKHYEYCRFLDREGFTGKLRECRMVITHGGTGVIIGAVNKGKSDRSAETCQLRGACGRSSGTAASGIRRNEPDLCLL